jgi:ATP-dependent Clp protease ATP-binding subunit ClpC
VTAPEIRSARAHVLVCEQFDGNCLVFPVVSPELASYDREEGAIAEQSLFLREYLARSPPEVIARLSLPEGSRLHSVGVVLPREDLPRRLQSETLVTFVCVVIPSAKDAWVIVPNLHHTFYVQEDEPLDEAIRAEVRRLLHSQELTPWEQMGLLPARDHRLEVLEIPLPDADREGGHGETLRKAIAERARRKQAVAALSAVSTPLHVAARNDKPPPLVGRESESALLTSLLDGEDRLSVLLVGPEHAGKSALVRAFLARSGRLVYSTSGAQLIAGMSGLGQWQERIRQVMEAVESLDAILYFENLEDLLAERIEEGGPDLGGAMRPYLDEGRVRVLAELRPDRLDALEGRHWALFATLSRIKVEPLSAAQSQIALQRRAEHDARTLPHKPRVELDALSTLIDLAERYLPYGTFPGKAIRLYEDLRATREKERGASGAPVSIGRRELYEAFSLTTGVPEFLLRDDRTLRIDDVASALEKQIIGQGRAVHSLSETIGVVKAGLQPSGKPLATFLFVGPTGVGKTELARALAEFLFGSPDRMVRFDMSEFMTADAAERLIRGTDRADGLLTQKVREQPFCVLLLDEIEKAHPAVFDLLLQVCGEGRLTDARGRTAFFHNAILIMTSNLGAAERRTQAGFGGATTPDEAHYQKLVNSTFRQEFVNRLDRIVPFRALARAEVEEVARLAVAKIRRRRGLDEAGVTLSVSDAALSRFAEEGFSAAYGARALRRHMDEHLAGPLGRLLSRLGGEAKELFIDVTLDSEPEERREGLLIASLPIRSFRFQVRRLRRLKSSQQVYGFDEIARLRRVEEGFMLLSPIEQLKDQLEFLVTQLNLTTDKSKSDRRRSSEVAELQAEHYRLREIWDKLVKAEEEIHAVEELSIMALFEGQEVLPFLPDGRAAYESFRRALPYALVALEPRRDEITLILEELDDGAFDLWLDPLLQMLPKRRISATIHVDGGERLADDDWPTERRWGPPRTAEWLRSELHRPNRSFRSLLLRCKGPYAGVFLALETGLHRMVLPRRAEDKGADDERSHVYVHLIARKAEIDADGWEHKALAPPQAGTAGTRRRGAAAREHDRVQKVVFVAGRRRRLEIDPGEYWAHQEEIALEHLLLFELDEGGLDRDEYFAPPGDEE